MVSSPFLTSHRVLLMIKPIIRVKTDAPTMKGAALQKSELIVRFGGWASHSTSKDPTNAAATAIIAARIRLTQNLCPRFIRTRRGRGILSQTSHSCGYSDFGYGFE